MPGVGPSDEWLTTLADALDGPIDITLLSAAAGSVDGPLKSSGTGLNPSPSLFALVRASRRALHGIVVGNPTAAYGQRSPQRSL